MGKWKLLRDVGLITVFAVALAGCSSGEDTTIAMSPADRPPKPAKHIIATEPLDTSPPRPWTPPKAGFPKAFTNAAAILLKLGLPDPRGGLFVSANVRDSSTQVGNPVLQTYGWIRPDSSGRPALLGLDGIWYLDVDSFTPFHGDLPVGDLTRQMLAKYARMYTSSFSLGNSRWDPQPDSVPRGASLASALLLIGGRTKEAEAMLRSAGPSATFDGMAADYLRAKWERCLAQYENWRDDLALKDCLEAVDLRTSCEKESAKIGKPAKFAFMDQASDLAAQLPDQVKPAKPATRGSSDADTVARLVDNLLDVSYVRNGGQRTYTPAGIAESLIWYQVPAATALIKAIDGDKRLSRVPEQTPEGRCLVPLSELAIPTFLELTDAPLPSDATPVQIRSWWEKNKNLPPSEWNFQALSDNSARPQQWEWAAQRIAGPAKTVAGEAPAESPGRKSQEELRIRVHPSVTDLMTLRVHQLMTQSLSGPHPENGDFNGARSDASELLASLRIWDPSVGDAIGRSTDEQLLASARKSPYWQNKHYEGNVLGQSLAARVRAGDAVATVQLRELIEHAQDPEIFFDQRTIEYFGEHRTEARFKGFAKSVFLDPAMRIVKSGGHPEFVRSNQLMVLTAAESSALQDPDVFLAVMTLLKDTAAFGTITSDGSSAKVGSQNGGQMEWSFSPDPLALPKGSTGVYRVCDMTMERLTMLRGVGNFRPFWRTEAKDAAIQKAIALLQAHRSDVATLTPLGQAATTAAPANP